MPPIFLIMYIGRFAPSPSGRLHFGSLVCALGSYLVARKRQGRFLLRIEDLDKPRCSDFFTKTIIKELEILGFDYDDKPYIQSLHQDNYFDAIDLLLKNNEAYYCNCTRAKLKEKECNCNLHQETIDLNKPYSIRYKIPSTLESFFIDELQGKVENTFTKSSITLKRADNIIAYNLACVVDDILQGVTQVVRGCDLIDITTTQRALYKSLGHEPISYLHLPLIMADSEHKLSKQNHATPVLDTDTPENLLLKALKVLKVNCENIHPQMSCQKILQTAVDNFNFDSLNRKNRIFLD